jgi:hypothetical protein
MVIIISVMPLFTYPNLSLHNNRVIIVLCELQIFSYSPIRVWHVFIVTGCRTHRPPVRWCPPSWSFIVLRPLRWRWPPAWIPLEARVLCLDACWPWLHLDRSFPEWPHLPCKKYEGVLLIWLRSECVRGAHRWGCVLVQGSLWPLGSIPNNACPNELTGPACPRPHMT